MTLVRGIATALIALVLVGRALSVAIADEKTDAAITPAAAKEAREIFDTRCSVCHGKEGKGDGPGSAGLTPKPRDLTDPEWQKSVDDAYIEKIVQYGGMAVGRSAMMPGNPDLNAKPDVVKGIRAVVRELGHHK
jgi:mono/diheme cytochrome c family protein